MDGTNREENMDENLNKTDNSGSDQQEPQSNLKVGLYARVSTSDQSLNTQLSLLREYSQRQNFSDVTEYIDTASGKDDRRPGFTQLLNDVRANKINCIVVYKLDRIGRSLKHLLALFEEFLSKKIEFISITQNINTTSPEGKLFVRLLMILSEFERELIVSRTLAGLARAKKEGKILGRPRGRKDKAPRKTSGYVERWKEWRERKKLSTNSHGK